MREISREAEEEIGGAATRPRPGTSSPAGCSRRSPSAASANFVWATQRARWLAHQVAEHFAEDRDQLLPALRTDPSDALRSVRPMAARGRASRGPRAARLLTGMRGGYMGVLMFGMVGTFVGLRLASTRSASAPAC